MGVRFLKKKKKYISIESSLNSWHLDFTRERNARRYFSTCCLIIEAYFGQKVQSYGKIRFVNEILLVQQERERERKRQTHT